MTAVEVANDSWDFLPEELQAIGDAGGFNVFCTEHAE
jgi:hypothetical protein